MRTRVTDANDVERGTVGIPIGWHATIGEYADGHYTVMWDADPDGRDMVHCLWTREEILRDAVLVPREGVR
jgi:hypothetical protein